MKQSRQEVLDYLLQSLSDLAHDWDYAEEIGPQTLMFKEMGLDSLDLVVLGTNIQEHYKMQLPFAEFLAAVGERGQQDVSVNELVDFVYENLNKGEVISTTSTTPPTTGALR